MTNLSVSQKQSLLCLVKREITTHEYLSKAIRHDENECYQLAIPETEEGEAYFKTLNRLRDLRREVQQKNKVLASLSKSLKADIRSHG